MTVWVKHKVGPPIKVRLSSFDTLTARAAVTARNLALGRGHTATVVSDNGVTSYLVTKMGARKLTG
jgi:hypothetical protein